MIVGSPIENSASSFCGSFSGHKARGRGEGFTLVELLVVVAIIGILCVLLLSAFPRIIGAADSAKCASNLRTVGQAINSYVNDNSHVASDPNYSHNNGGNPVPGQLPGPITHGQTPVSSRAFEGNFAYLLYPYLGLPEPKGNPNPTSITVSLFQCPAWKKQSANPTNVCYLAPDIIVYQGVTNINQPFGYPASGGNALVPPMRMVALPPVSLSEIMVLQDVDQMNASAGPLPYDTLPKKPVHNGKRNTLYLDDHVATQ